jgi:hypothetical protein
MPILAKLEGIDFFTHIGFNSTAFNPYNLFQSITSCPLNEHMTLPAGLGSAVDPKAVFGFLNVTKFEWTIPLPILTHGTEQASQNDSHVTFQDDTSVGLGNNDGIGTKKQLFKSHQTKFNINKTARKPIPSPEIQPTSDMSVTQSYVNPYISTTMPPSTYVIDQNTKSTLPWAPISLRHLTPNTKYKISLKIVISYDLEQTTLQYNNNNELQNELNTNHVIIWGQLYKIQMPTFMIDFEFSVPKIGFFRPKFPDAIYGGRFYPVLLNTTGFTYIHNSYEVRNNKTIWIERDPIYDTTPHPFDLKVDDEYVQNMLNHDQVQNQQSLNIAQNDQKETSLFPPQFFNSSTNFTTKTRLIDTTNNMPVYLWSCYTPFYSEYGTRFPFSSGTEQNVDDENNPNLEPIFSPNLQYRNCFPNSDRHFVDIYPPAVSIPVDDQDLGFDYNTDDGSDDEDEIANYTHVLNAAQSNSSKSKLEICPQNIEDVGNFANLSKRCQEHFQNADYFFQKRLLRYGIDPQQYLKHQRMVRLQGDIPLGIHFGSNITQFTQESIQFLSQLNVKEIYIISSILFQGEMQTVQKKINFFPLLDHLLPFTISPGAFQSMTNTEIEEGVDSYEIASTNRALNSNFRHLNTRLNNNPDLQPQQSLTSSLNTPGDYQSYLSNPLFVQNINTERTAQALWNDVLFWKSKKQGDSTQLQTFPNSSEIRLLVLPTEFTSHLMGNNTTQNSQILSAQNFKQPFTYYPPIQSLTSIMINNLVGSITEDVSSGIHVAWRQIDTSAIDNEAGINNIVDGNGSANNDTQQNRMDNVERNSENDVNFVHNGSLETLNEIDNVGVNFEPTQITTANDSLGGKNNAQLLFADPFSPYLRISPINLIVGNHYMVQYCQFEKSLSENDKKIWSYFSNSNTNLTASSSLDNYKNTVNYISFKRPSGFDVISAGNENRNDTSMRLGNDDGNIELQSYLRSGHIPSIYDLISPNFNTNYPPQPTPTKDETISIQRPLGCSSVRFQIVTNDSSAFCTTTATIPSYSANNNPTEVPEGFYNVTSSCQLYQDFDKIDFYPDQSADQAQNKVGDLFQNTIGAQKVQPNISFSPQQTPEDPQPNSPKSSQTTIIWKLAPIIATNVDYSPYADVPYHSFEFSQGTTSSILLPPGEYMIIAVNYNTSSIIYSKSIRLLPPSNCSRCFEHYLRYINAEIQFIIGRHPYYILPSIFPNLDLSGRPSSTTKPLNGTRMVYGVYQIRDVLELGMSIVDLSLANLQNGVTMYKDEIKTHIQDTRAQIVDGQEQFYLWFRNEDFFKEFLEVYADGSAAEAGAIDMYDNEKLVSFPYSEHLIRLYKSSLYLPTLLTNEAVQESMDRIIASTYRLFHLKRTFYPTRNMITASPKPSTLTQNSGPTNSTFVYQPDSIDNSVIIQHFSDAITYYLSFFYQQQVTHIRALSQTQIQADNRILKLFVDISEGVDDQIADYTLTLLKHLGLFYTQLFLNPNIYSEFITSGSTVSGLNTARGIMQTMSNPVILDQTSVGWDELGVSMNDSSSSLKFCNRPPLHRNIPQTQMNNLPSFQPLQTPTSSTPHPLSLLEQSYMTQFSLNLANVVVYSIPLQYGTQSLNKQQTGLTIENKRYSTDSSTIGLRTPAPATTYSIDPNIRALDIKSSADLSKNARDGVAYTKVIDFRVSDSFQFSLFYSEFNVAFAVEDDLSLQAQSMNDQGQINSNGSEKSQNGSHFEQNIVPSPTTHTVNFTTTPHNRHFPYPLLLPIIVSPITLPHFHQQADLPLPTAQSALNGHSLNISPLDDTRDSISYTLSSDITLVNKDRTYQSLQLILLQHLSTTNNFLHSYQKVTTSTLTYNQDECEFNPFYAYYARTAGFDSTPQSCTFLLTSVSPVALISTTPTWIAKMARFWTSAVSFFAPLSSIGDITGIGPSSALSTLFSFSTNVKKLYQNNLLFDLLQQTDSQVQELPVRKLNPDALYQSDKALLRSALESKNGNKHGTIALFPNLSTTETFIMYPNGTIPVTGPKSYSKPLFDIDSVYWYDLKENTFQFLAFWNQTSTYYYHHHSADQNSDPTPDPSQNQSRYYSYSREGGGATTANSGQFETMNAEPDECANNLNESNIAFNQNCSLENDKFAHETPNSRSSFTEQSIASPFLSWFARPPHIAQFSAPYYGRDSIYTPNIQCEQFSSPVKGVEAWTTEGCSLIGITPLHIMCHCDGSTPTRLFTRQMNNEFAQFVIYIPIALMIICVISSLLLIGRDQVITSHAFLRTAMQWQHMALQLHNYPYLIYTYGVDYARKIAEADHGVYHQLLTRKTVMEIPNPNGAGNQGDYILDHPELNIEKENAVGKRKGVSRREKHEKREYKKLRSGDMGKNKQNDSQKVESESVISPVISTTASLASNSSSAPSESHVSPRSHNSKDSNTSSSSQKDK